MHGIKFESFAKFIFERKNPFMCGFICLQYMYFIYVPEFMYRRGFIVQLFRPWLRHNGLQNLIRVLHSMVNSNSYVRIRVKIMNL